MSRALAPLLAVLFLALPFAGCLDDEGAPAPAVDTEDGLEGGPTVDVEDPATGEVVQGLAKPEWEVGHYWTFEGSDGREPTFVVSEDRGDHWMMDTTDDQFAFFTAIADISTLGLQRKSDLAGSQGSDRIRFFDFPLTDGKSWETVWDGEPHTVTAAKTGDTEYTMAATRADGSTYAEYSIDADSHWFRSLTYYGADGTEQYSATLKEHASDWTGEVLRYTVEEAFLAHHGDDTRPVNAEQTSVTLRADQTDLFMLLHLDCDTGVFSLTVKHDDGQTGWDHHMPCGQMGMLDVVADTPGTYQVALVDAAPGDADRYFVQLFTRTLETFQVG